MALQSTPLQCQLAPPCQISCRSVKPFHTYGRFKKLEILTSEAQNASSCIIVPNFVQIGQGVAEISRFLFFKMAAVRHLGFLKVRNFNCTHPSGGQNASPCQILCRWVKPLQRYGRFRFFKMAAVRRLGFSKVRNVNCPHHSGGQNASPCQILIF